MVGAYLPPPSVQALSDGEQRLVANLANKLTVQSVHMMIANSYYEGTQRLFQLGISIPPKLAGIRTVVDWPRICVDPLVQRSVVDGFRMPGQTDVDAELAQHWQANNLDAEAPLCFLDALVYGRGYMIVGSPDTRGDSPLVTVESPLNMTLNWDPRRRMVTAAYQSYEAEGVYQAALYLPDQNIFMSRDQSSQWVVNKRDRHGFGEVSVVRFANRTRASDREGRSEITPAVRNTTDSACRTLLGMEIGREFYSIPHLYGLGLTERDFVDKDGNQKSGLDMAMDKFTAFERDKAGLLPTVGQFKAMDPGVFTKILDKHGQLIASYTQFPPEWFGMTPQSNPASADAIRSAQDGVNRRANQVNRERSDPLEDTQRLVWRFANGGAQVPVEMKRLETDWEDTATPTPAATTDSVQKQIASGVLAPWSDVTKAKLGYSATQRQQITQDWKGSAALQLEALLTSSLAARQARAANAIASDLEVASEGGEVTPPPK